MAVASAAPIPRSVRVRRGLRRATRFAALWAFGVATTLLLIGLWGRAVATDEATLAASARAVVDTEVVSDRISGWIGDGLAVAAAVAPPDVAGVVADVRAMPETQRAIDDLIDQAVSAALATPGTANEIDVAAALIPLAPVVSEQLEAAGLEVPAAAVEAALRSVAVVVVDTQDDVGLAGAAVEARSALTRVVVAAAVAMLLSATAAIALAEQRMAMMRSLLFRITLSAVTFALILRLGAWAVDPSGGRSPVAAGGAVLLGSNAPVLVAVATVSGLAAAVGWMGARRRPVAPH